MNLQVPQSILVSLKAEQSGYPWIAKGWQPGTIKFEVQEQFHSPQARHAFFDHVEPEVDVAEGAFL